MKRLGSLRFDGVLVQTKRDAAARLLSSAGVSLASWTEAGAGARTYALLELPEGDAELPVPDGARFDRPALTVLDIIPRDRTRVPALLRALRGPGRPAGVVDAVAAGAGVIAELASPATLRLVLDLIDVELEPSPGRTIVPVLPLADDALSALTAATLGIGDLNARRLIEAFSEPLLAGGLS